MYIWHWKTGESAQLCWEPSSVLSHLIVELSRQPCGPSIAMQEGDPRAGNTYDRIVVVPLPAIVHIGFNAEVGSLEAVHIYCGPGFVFRRVARGDESISPYLWNDMSMSVNSVYGRHFDLGASNRGKISVDVLVLVRSR